MQPVGTIGYQETPPEAVMGALRASGTDVLVDVRAIASSRRPGFSKSQLSSGVSELGIEYLHLRGLGTPAEGRLAARTGRYAELQRIYTEHLATPAAQGELDQLISIVRSGRRVCLLCFERRPEHCHRTIVAEAVSKRLGVAVEHLQP